MADYDWYDDYPDVHPDVLNLNQTQLETDIDNLKKDIATKNDLIDKMSLVANFTKLLIDDDKDALEVVKQFYENPQKNSNVYECMLWAGEDVPGTPLKRWVVNHGLGTYKVNWNLVFGAEPVSFTTSPGEGKITFFSSQDLRGSKVTITKTNEYVRSSNREYQ